MTEFLILILLLFPILASHTVIALIGYNTMIGLGNKPSLAPRLFIKMIIITFLVEIFAASILSLAMLLFAKKPQ